MTQCLSSYKVESYLRRFKLLRYLITDIESLQKHDQLVTK